MIFSFVFPISGTEWKDKENGTKMVHGTKWEHFKSISMRGQEAEAEAEVTRGNATTSRCKQSGGARMDA
jgi:hypothetical protein